MIHIMHMLHNFSSTGGTARKLLYLVKHSDRDRIRHSFLSMKSGDLVSAIERAGGRVVVINSESPVTVTRAALRLIKKLQPDVVGTHFTRAFICGKSAARLLGLPVVHHEHYPASLDRSDQSAGKLLSCALRKAWLPQVEAIICNSMYTAAAVTEMFGIDKRLLRVVYNPVERRLGASVSQSKQQLRIADKQGVTIGHVGGMAWWRDQATLITAISILRERGWNARLIVVGDGAMRASLEALTARLGIQHCVEFAGYQTDLTEFYRNIDIYSNPSLAEGFGIAVVEAMLEGKPVVLANAGAHPELIADDRTGVLYAASNAESLADCLVQLLNDRDYMARLANAGRDHAQQAFAPHRYAESYQTIIEDVLSAAGAKHSSRYLQSDRHDEYRNHK